MSDHNGTSMAGVFLNQVDKYGANSCVAYKDDGQYRDIAWTRMGDMVVRLACFLISMEVKPGDKIAIFSPNRYEWWISDLAVLAIGAVDVPIYATNSAEETFYILDHSGAKGCFVGGDENVEKVFQIKDRLPNLEFIVSYDPSGKKDVYYLSEAFEKGQGQNAEKEFHARLESVKPTDPATIIYTSGTTGPPKGVVLSHHNFISNISQIREDFHNALTDQDVFLSFLPLSHALERVAGYYMPIVLGAKVVFAESFQHLQQNLVEVRPTVIISVPRLYEKIHAGVLSQVKKAAFFKRVLFGWAMGLARKNLPYICRKAQRKGLLAVTYLLADALIFSKLKTALGMDRIKIAVSGGGPLTVTDTEFFLGMEIILLEGYGLTETTPVTHVNRPWMIKPGTVGTPLKDTEIRFSDEDEVLIKGPQVMMGYYNDEERTRKAFTEDGFFRSGDMGKVDEDGYLHITGRIKDIIITSGGKNISPLVIESRLQESMLIEQVGVIGDRRKFLSALIAPAFEALKQWAEYKGIPFADNEDLIQNERVVAKYQKEIDKCMLHLSQTEKIKKFKLISEAWSQQTGEMTPTLKLKRNVLEKKYKDIIDEMYQE